MVNRQGLVALIYDIYGVRAEHPFARDPDTAVFRHVLGRKWFAVIMKIPKRRLGIDGEGEIDIVNLKCADEIIFSMQQESGIYPAYHMNKSHWLSVSLDGSVSDETVAWLLGISYDLTEKR